MQVGSREATAGVGVGAGMGMGMGVGIGLGVQRDEVRTSGCEPGGASGARRAQTSGSGWTKPVGLGLEGLHWGNTSCMSASRERWDPKCTSASSIARHRARRHVRTSGTGEAGLLDVKLDRWGGAEGGGGVPHGPEMWGHGQRQSGGGREINCRLVGATYAVDLRAFHSKMWRSLVKPMSRGDERMLSL